MAQLVERGNKLPRLLRASPKGTNFRGFAAVPGPHKPERGYEKQKDGTKNRNECTFAKTALL